tara:strand:- start:377 stop:799 length:423 start_codon:yes stop_codon:yes gene_type:complete
MHTSQSQAQYKRELRIPVDIPVRVDSVLVSTDAILRNLTEHGALIEGISLPKGAQFQIDYEGQIVFGIVAWAEDDRIGARFPFVLDDGPLYTRLQQAVIAHEVQKKGATRVRASSPSPHMQRPAPGPLRRAAGGFGRRGL